MAKFNNLPGAAMASINNVAKKAQEKATVVVLKNILVENLVDNPKNGEDIKRTGDLETSMKANGFTDPLEVTSFGMPEGKFMILSGHRRRAAAVKVFGSEFAIPCVIRDFKDAKDVQNYTLMANAQRDSAKDPLLLSTRYKMHDEYLTSVGFAGTEKEKTAEIAKRLDISIAQAFRYKAMNNVILPVWDMVRDTESGKGVGLTSVSPMAKFTEDEQYEILEIMRAAQAKDVMLTRDTMSKIIKGFESGKKTWAEIADLPRDSGLPLNGFVNPEPGPAKEPKEADRNDEMRREHDEIAANYDEVQRQQEQWQEQQAEQEAAMGTADDEAPAVEEATGTAKDTGKPTEKEVFLSPEEKQLKRGEDISKLLGKLDTLLSEVWKAKNEGDAKIMAVNMGSIARVLVSDIHSLCKTWDMMEEYDSFLQELNSTVEENK